MRCSLEVASFFATAAIGAEAISSPRPKNRANKLRFFAVRKTKVVEKK
jgi:hypothetical protein